MAKYKTTIIDEETYELHPVKTSGTLIPIGFVPILVSDNIADYVERLGDKAAIEYLKRGLAIQLQALARKSSENSDKFTDAVFNQIAPKLLAENAEKYVQNFALLRADCKQYFLDNQTTVEHDSDKIWEEYI